MNEILKKGQGGQMVQQQEQLMKRIAYYLTHKSAEISAEMDCLLEGVDEDSLCDLLETVGEACGNYPTGTVITALSSMMAAVVLYEKEGDPEIGDGAVVLACFCRLTAHWQQLTQEIQ